MKIYEDANQREDRRGQVVEQEYSLILLMVYFNNTRIGDGKKIDKFFSWHYFVSIILNEIWFKRITQKPMQSLSQVASWLTCYLNSKNII